MNLQYFYVFLLFYYFFICRYTSDYNINDTATIKNESSVPIPTTVHTTPAPTKPIIENNNKNLTNFDNLTSANVHDNHIGIVSILNHATEDYETKFEKLVLTTPGTIDFDKIQREYIKDVGGENRTEPIQTSTTSLPVGDSVAISYNSTNELNSTTFYRNTELENSSYDLQANEIQNTTQNVESNGTTPTSTTKRGKYLQDASDTDVNLTIPNTAEVWALASMKKTLDRNKIRDGQYYNVNASVVDHKQQKPNNNSMVTKQLADWVEVMKAHHATNNESSFIGTNLVPSKPVSSKLDKLVAADGASQENHIIGVRLSTQMPQIFDNSKHQQNNLIKTTTAPSINVNTISSQSQIDKIPIADNQIHKENLTETELIDSDGTTSLANDITTNGIAKETFETDTKKNCTGTAFNDCETEAKDDHQIEVTEEDEESSTTDQTDPTTNSDDRIIHLETTTNSLHDLEDTTVLDNEIHGSTIAPIIVETVTPITEPVSSQMPPITTQSTTQSIIMPTIKQQTTTPLSVSSSTTILQTTFSPIENKTDEPFETNLIDRTSEESKNISQTTTTPSTTSSTTKIEKEFPFSTIIIDTDINLDLAHQSNDGSDHNKQKQTDTAHGAEGEDESDLDDDDMLFDNVLENSTTTTTVATTFRTGTILVGNELGGYDGREETDVNAIIAISVSVVGVVCLILLVAFLVVMRKRQKQLTYGQRCRPVGLDAYSLDNVSVYNSVRRKGQLRQSKRAYGNAGFDDPALKNNLLTMSALATFAANRHGIYEEFKELPTVTARVDEVPAGCEDKNR